MTAKNLGVKIDVVDLEDSDFESFQGPGEESDNVERNINMDELGFVYPNTSNPMVVDNINFANLVQEDEDSDSGSDAEQEEGTEQEPLVLKILGLKVVPSNTVSTANSRIKKLTKELEAEKAARVELEKKLETQACKQSELENKVKTLESELVQARKIEVSLVDNVIIMSKGFGDLITKLLGTLTPKERKNGTHSFTVGPFKTEKELQEVLLCLNAISEHLLSDYHHFSKVNKDLEFVNKILEESKTAGEHEKECVKAAEDYEACVIDADSMSDSEQDIDEDASELNQSNNCGSNGHQDHARNPAAVAQHAIDESRKHGWFCVCGAVFRSKETVRHHVKTNTTDKKFKCTSCPRKFLYRFMCDKHMINAHGISYVPMSTIGCSTCGKSFRSRFVYDHHNCRLKHPYRAGNGRSRSKRDGSMDASRGHDQGRRGPGQGRPKAGQKRARAGRTVNLNVQDINSFGPECNANVENTPEEESCPIVIDQTELLHNYSVQ